MFVQLIAEDLVIRRAALTRFCTTYRGKQLEFTFHCTTLLRKFLLCKTVARQTERQPVRTYRMTVISGSLFGLSAVFCTETWEIIEWAVRSCLKADFGFLLLVESLRIGFIFHCILILVLDFLKFLYDTQGRNWVISILSWDFVSERKSLQWSERLFFFWIKCVY